MNNQFANPMLMGGMPMNNNMNNMNMMGMGFMPMNMNMMGNGGMQMNEDEEWLKGFNMGYEEVTNPGNADPDLEAPGPKITAHFCQKKAVFRRRY